MRYAIGLDVGGSFIKYGLVGEDGELLRSGERAMDARRGVAGLEDSIRSALEAAREGEGPEPVAVGIGLPGTLRPGEGEVLTAPAQIPGILGWRAVERLTTLSGLPAAADNDATIAGFAEARVGAGRGRETVLLVTVGTGVGGGLVVGGRPVRGPCGTGGEIGHIVLHPDGLPCPAHEGGRGCLELYASATALARRYREAGGAAREPRQIVDAALAGSDPLATETLRAVGHDLGLGLVTAASLVAPDVVLIGGGLSAAGEALRGPAEHALRTRSLPYVGRTPVLLAGLGNRAGVVGAALLALSPEAAPSP